MIIIFTILIGTTLLFLEFILPSFGLLGLGGFLCFLYAILEAFSSYGVVGGSIVSAVCLVLSVFIMIFAIKFFPKMKFTKSLSLKTEETPVVDDSADFVGKKGVAITDMALTGKILLEGIEYEAQSNLEFIEKGSEVEVVAKDNFKLVVKKI